jgi:hypothetical protein
MIIKTTKADRSVPRRAGCPTGTECRFLGGPGAWAAGPESQPTTGPGWRGAQGLGASAALVTTGDRRGGLLKAQCHVRRDEPSAGGELSRWKIVD